MGFQGLHFLVMTYKIPFPGYAFPNSSGVYVDVNGEEVDQPQQLPNWMYFLLIIPSVFDLVATALCMYGLRYVDVSIYQILRGDCTKRILLFSACDVVLPGDLLFQGVPLYSLQFSSNLFLVTS